MSNTVTLASLRTAVQQRGGYENSQDITGTVLVGFINEAIAELYDLMVQKWADYYTVLSNDLVFIGDSSGTGDSIAVTGGVVTYTDAGAAFTAPLVGSRITIAGAANAGNNGTFRITGVTSATVLTYTNAGAVNETAAFAWSIKGSNAIPLPVDFYKLRKVELRGSGERWHRLFPHDLEAGEANTTPNVLGRLYRYRMQAGNLMLSPDPGGTTTTVRIYYIPYAQRLSADADVVEGWNQYEELIVQLAFRRCKAREELDTSDIEREIERLSQRIRVSADARDAEPFYLDPEGPPYGYAGGGDDDGDWY
jgi:hypothetical protein